MPVNRAPFNALVDDDGSGNVGTPWEKARIAGVILDPLDVELAPPTCHVTAVSRQTAIAPNVWGALEYDTVIWQTSPGMCNVPTSIITIPITGYYLVEGCVTFPQGDGIRGLTVYANGAPAPGMGGQQVLQAATLLTYNVLKVSVVINIGTGAILQLAAFQNTAAGIWAGGIHAQTTNSMQVTLLRK